jgi:hypothetical protein
MVHKTSENTFRLATVLLALLSLDPCARGQYGKRGDFLWVFFKKSMNASDRIVYLIWSVRAQVGGHAVFQPKCERLQELFTRSEIPVDGAMGNASEIRHPLDREIMHSFL